MKGWPKPNEVSRQIWLATYAVKLAEDLNVRGDNIIAEIKRRLTEGKAATAEDALLDMYALWEQPAPAMGQQHLIISEGALVAPGCWNCDPDPNAQPAPDAELCARCVEPQPIRSGPWGLE